MKKIIFLITLLCFNYYLSSAQAFTSADSSFYVNITKQEKFVESFSSMSYLTRNCLGISWAGWDKKDFYILKNNNWQKLITGWDAVPFELIPFSVEEVSKKKKFLGLIFKDSEGNLWKGIYDLKKESAVTLSRSD